MQLAGSDPTGTQGSTFLTYFPVSTHLPVLSLAKPLGCDTVHTGQSPRATQQVEGGEQILRGKCKSFQKIKQDRGCDELNMMP